MSFLDEFTPTYNSDNRPKHYCKRENEMTIGSTATHIFNLPFTYSEYVKYCEIIYKQGTEVKLVKKDFNVQEANDEYNAESIITVTLSPVETCLFKDIICNTYVQVKIINNFNEVSYSTPNKIKVLNSLDEGGITNFGYSYKNKINDYLYEIAFDNLDYKLGNDYFKNDNKDYLGACTSIRWDGLLARNYDWNYDKWAVFVVRTNNQDGFYSTIGVSGSVVGFDAGTNDEDSDKYKVLPFRIVDGINEKGLAMSINVVPSLNNKATKTTESQYDEVCVGMIVRYCLDRYASVEELKRELPRHTSLFPMKKLANLGFEIHALIADKNNTTILEIIDDEIKFLNVIDYLHEIITNFHLTGVELLENYNVYTPEDVVQGLFPSMLGIEAHGSGLERFNYAINELSKINGQVSEEALRSVMNGLNYTNAYKELEKIWYTEFVGNYDKDIELTVDNTPEDFAFAIAGDRELYSHRERGDKKTWFTEHSSIYDIENKRLYLVNQEETEKEYIFTL